MFHTWTQVLLLPAAPFQHAAVPFHCCAIPLLCHPTAVSVATAQPPGGSEHCPETKSAADFTLFQLSITSELLTWHSDAMAGNQQLGNSYADVHPSSI